MVKKCCVLGCRSESVKNCGISFFTVPKNESLLQLWKDIVPGKLMKYSVVCHLHFKKEDIMCLSAKPKLRLDAVPSIFNTDAQPNTPRSELTVPTTCISKGPERYLEIPPLTKAPMKRPKVTVTASQNTNPLYLENEPMDTIDQDQKSDHNLSIKSESISIKSDGFEEDFIDDEEVKLEDSEEETNSKRPNRNKEIDDVEENDLEEDDSFDIDEEDKNDCKDYDESVNTSDTSEDDDFEEAPMPIPTTITVSKTMMTNKQDEESQKRNTEILRKKILALHKQLKRKDNKLKQLQSQMNLVKNYTRCSEIENILRGNYRKLCVAINKNGVPVNYSDDVIKFAISVNYYSPKAYEFIRKHMSLPNTRMLEKYASTGTYIINLDDE